MSSGRAPRLHKVPWFFYLGSAILILGQIGLRMEIRWIATWLTPIMWTGYILTIDGLTYAVHGKSWICSSPRDIPLLVLLSVAIWLVFEAYNLHLKNWYYTGLPDQSWLRDFGYFWSFATIMPGVFTTVKLLTALHTRIAGSSSIPKSAEVRLGPPWLWFLIGSSLLTIPLALPARTAAFLFGAVWLGFFFLIEPINLKLGIESTLADLQRSRFRPLMHFLLGGFICGLLWETWNQQAVAYQGAFWVYTVPQELRIFDWHFGQMPVLGLLGFPPFALELRAMYGLLRELLGGQRVFGRRGLSQDG